MVMKGRERKRGVFSIFVLIKQSKRGRCLDDRSRNSSYSEGAVLGDGLGALADGVLGELTWEEETDGSLDLSGGESVLAVVSDESGALSGDLLEDVVDEGVHDAHGSLGDTGLWVDLLEDSVDVDREGLGSSTAWSCAFSGGLDLALWSWFASGFCHFIELSF